MADKSKKAIRADMLAKRRALTYDEISLASKQASELLIHSDSWRQAQHIAFYIAHDSEIDPKGLMDLAHRQNKHCYLPALASDDLKHLVMVRYQPGDPLPKNRYGIPEPVQNEAAIIAPSELDLVVVPLVAFDTTGARLGMGVGYYDRTFAFLNQPDRPQHPLFVGFAYSFQYQAGLQHENWDVGLDYIVTEQEIVNTTNHFKA